MVNISLKSRQAPPRFQKDLPSRRCPFSKILHSEIASDAGWNRDYSRSCGFRLSPRHSANGAWGVPLVPELTVTQTPSEVGVIGVCIYICISVYILYLYKNTYVLYNYMFFKQIFFVYVHLSFFPEVGM